MNNFSDEMRAGIRRYVEDVDVEIPARFILAFGNHDTQKIQNILDHWAQEQQIQIIQPISTCSPNEVCILVLKYIDSDPPVKGIQDQIDTKSRASKYFRDVSSNTAEQDAAANP